MDAQTLQTITANFLKELQDANAGKKTSLPFIINQLPSSPIVKDGETFQAMVIGGSICRKGLMRKDGSKITIMKQEEKTQSVFNTKEDLMEFVDKELDPSVRILGVNFAAPIEAIFKNNHLDGILLRGTKEHMFTGLVGKGVGAEIESYASKKGQSLTVSLANDIICLLLSGLTRFKPDDLACLIVGTGMNGTFFLDEHHAVNLESNSFDKFPRDDEQKKLDASSALPGTALFEKAITGAYLYRYLAMRAEKERINFPKISSTKELNELATQDKGRVGEIAKDIFIRSAQFIACQVAAMLQFKNQNLTVVAEGSLFWKGYRYKETVEETVKRLAPSYNASFVEIPDSALLGAAKLVA